MPAREMDHGESGFIPKTGSPYEISYDSVHSIRTSDRTIAGFKFRISDFIDITRYPPALHSTNGGVSNADRDWDHITPRLLIRSGVKGLSVEDHFGGRAFIPVRDEDSIIIERSGMIIIDPNDPDDPDRYHRFDPRNFKSCKLVTEEPAETHDHRQAAGASVHRLGGLMELKVYIPTDEPPSGELKMHYGGLDLESHPHRSGFTQRPEIEVVITGPEDLVRKFASSTFDTPEENIIDLDTERTNRESAMQQAA